MTTATEVKYITPDDDDVVQEGDEVRHIDDTTWSLYLNYAPGDTYGKIRSKWPAYIFRRAGKKHAAATEEKCKQCTRMKDCGVKCWWCCSPA